MAGGTDLPRHVAIERLDLDDVGTIVAEHLGGMYASLRDRQLRMGAHNLLPMLRMRAIFSDK